MKYQLNNSSMYGLLYYISHCFLYITYQIERQNIITCRRSTMRWCTLIQ